MPLVIAVHIGRQDLGGQIEWGWGLRGVAREKKGASKGLEGQPTFQDSFKLNKGMEFSGKTPVTGMTQG